jgi:hypothetical protein
MSFDLQRILESKRALRRRLAARPVAEKLQMLDALRERALAIRGPTRGTAGEASEVREEAPHLASGESPWK